MNTRLKFRIVAVAALVSSSLFGFARDGGDSAKAALNALFVSSDLQAAKSFADAALRENSKDLSALFVRMEVARLRLDDATELKTALRICEIDPEDPRAEIAAGRIRELAGNTTHFAAVVPTVKHLVDSAGRASANLKLALVAAANDGTPEFDLLQQSREYGLLTDWRIVGPFGTQAADDFDRPWAPEKNGGFRKLRNAFSDLYQFADGAVTLSNSSKSGIYYAQSEFDLPSSGTWRIRTQTLGTLQVFVDGKTVYNRDARSSQLPEVNWQNIRLEAGKHKTLVKFLPSASPFRIAVLPPSPGPKKRKTPTAIHAGPESEYITASLQYFEGDYEPLILSLSQSSKFASSTPFLVLLGDTWTKVEEDPPEASQSYSKALQVSSDCLRSLLRLSEIDLQAHRTKDLAARASILRAHGAQSIQAAEIAAKSYLRLGELESAAELYHSALDRHPSVENLRNALEVASAQGDLGRTNSLGQRLASSAKGALELSIFRQQQGRHEEAAHVIQAWTDSEPLDRRLWEQYAQESLVAGDFAQAQSSAEHLTEISPESELYSKLLSQAQQRTPFPDEPVEFWYANYRRKAEDILKQQFRQNSSPAVVQLLNDRVWRVRSDGTLDEYVHTMTKLATRGSIAQNAEFVLPDHAQLLTLRTWQPDGAVAEPELLPEKATISMPGLTPGAVIEAEYTVHQPLRALSSSPEFVFGSLDYPVEHARLVILADAAAELTFAQGPGAPREARTTWRSLQIHSWERDNISQLEREPAAPKTSFHLPSILLQTPALSALSRERLAVSLLPKTRPGPRAKVLAAKMASSTGRQTAQNLYDYVRKHILDDDAALEESATAEASLALHRGNRTVALIALAKAAGFNADLLLGSEYQDANRFALPLVHISRNGIDVTLDVESDDLPFAALKPSTSRNAMLLLPSGELKTIHLAEPGSEERSLARGDIQLSLDGSLRARIQIALGMTRGNELRRNLRTMTASARQHFLEDVASRIIPGVTSVEGRILNEVSALPLTIEVECRTGNVTGNLARISQSRLQQLVPGLGLRSMYATLNSRDYPVAIDSVLFENTSFRFTLPEGMELRLSNAEISIANAFGSYSSHARQVGTNVYEFSREFRFPMQVIQPSQYEAFKKTAEQIESAERSQVEITYHPNRS